MTHIAKQEPQITCTCIDYGQGPFTHMWLNMGGSEAVGTIFNPDLCQSGLVLRPTNEQVAECTQIPWNEAVRDDIYVRRGSSSIPPVSWTHGQFWFSKVLRKWQTLVSQTTNISLQFQLHAYLCTLLGPPWKGPQIPTSYKASKFILFYPNTQVSCKAVQGFLLCIWKHLLAENIPS